MTSSKHHKPRGPHFGCALPLFLMILLAVACATRQTREDINSLERQLLVTTNPIERSRIEERLAQKRELADLESEQSRQEIYATLGDIALSALEIAAYIFAGGGAAGLAAVGVKKFRKKRAS